MNLIVTCRRVLRHVRSLTLMFHAFLALIAGFSSICGNCSKHITSKNALVAAMTKERQHSAQLRVEERLHHRLDVFDVSPCVRPCYVPDLKNPPPLGAHLQGLDESYLRYLRQQSGLMYLTHTVSKVLQSPRRQRYRVTFLFREQSSLFTVLQTRG